MQMCLNIYKINANENILQRRLDFSLEYFNALFYHHF